jgi:erythrocyte membrane protein band 4.1
MEGGNIILLQTLTQPGSGGAQPIVQTESMVYSDPSTLGDPDLHSTTQVPVVATETRKVALESEDGAYSATGEIVSSQTISSKTRTVETITVCSLSVIQSS